MIKSVMAQVLAVCLLIMSAQGGVGKKDEDVSIPEPLRPWQNWVLEKHKDHGCPLGFSDSLKECVWPTELIFNVNENGATFEMKAQLFADAQLQLPGDSLYWPINVVVDKKNVPVVPVNGFPSVYLKRGDYRISGAFRWVNHPNAIKVPENTALVEMTMKNKKVPRINLDQNGLVWLKEQDETDTADTLTSDNLNVKIYRKVIDDIPVYIVTRMKLVVSGLDREVLLGKFLPDSAVPVYLHSEIPARIEPDGKIRVQVRAGTWIIEAKSRQIASHSRFTFSSDSRDWPEQEIWALQSNPHLRTVSIKGVPAIDPEQTGIPEEWKQLPVFLVSKGNTIEIVEEQRGDAAQETNSLRMNREMWLDFTGKGYTIKDQISGSFQRPGRLGMASGYTLGSVALNKIPQLVTTIDNSIPGIEYRPGFVELECLSRIECNKMSAAGWNHPFANVSTKLNLPPGWSIFHISGVDFVHHTWISKWNVWDLFLLLILVVSISRLYNIKWGLFAAFTFIITFHETGAPVFLWLNLVAGLALLKVLPKGKLHRVFAFYSTISLIVIFCVALVFAVIQVKLALYPQLEKNTNVKAEPVSVEYFEKSVDEPANDRELSVQKRSSYSKARWMNSEMAQNLQVYDAGAKIQTGPGEPAWNWNSINFGWSGPVESDQQIQIIAITPLINRLIKVLRVCSIFLLLFGLGRLLLKFAQIDKKFALSGKNIFTVLAFLFLSVLPARAYSEMPSQVLLNELESRLTQRPQCFPNCAAVQQGSVEITNNTAEIELVIDAAMDVAVPIPGNRTGWFPNQVKINGKDASALRSSNEGTLSIAVPQGHNRVVLTGSIYDSKCEIQFPLEVNNFSYNGAQWQCTGISNGKIPGGLLRFERKGSESVVTPKQPKNLLPDQAPPFIEVERKIFFDKEWTASTVVRRIAPESDPISIRIPLLTSESVISSVITDPIGFITVYMTRDQYEYTWHSTLKMSPEIRLEVPVQDKWTERWIIDASPRWHVETSGLLPIKQDAGNLNTLQEWHPKPGEKINITIQRPEPVTGPTMTIKKMEVNYRPGKKASENSLILNVLSSQADRISLHIGGSSVLEYVRIDDISQISSLNNGVLSVPVHPGMQNIMVKWKDKDSIGLFTRTPEINVGMNSSNVRISALVPQDRWLLFAGGPMMGPAVLYWAILAVLLFVSVLLSRVKALPVKWYHWFLLALGMSTVDNVGGVLVVIWFFVMAKRAAIAYSNPHFNRWQILCIVLSLAALGSLVVTIPLGLLSSPDMQIRGNFSTGHDLKWYQDISKAAVVQGWFISVPIWVYRLLMLLWSLWLALYMTKWIGWGWKSFTANGLWKSPIKNIVINKEAQEREVAKEEEISRLR